MQYSTTGSNGLLPTEGSDAVEILMNDHDVIKELLSRLMETSDNEGRALALEELKQVLTIHNATEENLVYPALQTVGKEKGKAERLYHETAQADVLIFQLDNLMKVDDDSACAAKLEELKSAILEHIEDEETSAFPNLRKNAASADQDALLNSVRKFRSMLRFVSASV